jgi:alpha-amylase
MKSSIRAVAVFAFLVFLAFASHAFAQAGFDDDRVMLQGFYWESYRHGHDNPRFERFGNKRWYQVVKDLAGQMRDARFDLIWLPPPSCAGELSAGYNSKQYWNLNNSYGDEALHRSMLKELWNKGVEPVADIVINHRDGDHSWADFKNPDWGLDTITRHDEAFTNPRSPVHGTPKPERGGGEEKPSEYASHGGTTYGYGSFRDLDHTNPQVRRDIIKYLLQLKSFGYRGWRYDMVHGYHAKRLANYNKRSQPTFSVGEYDWDKHGEQRGWIYHSATDPNAEPLTTSSCVFDFSTNWALKDNKTNYRAWYGFDNGLGIMGDTTDGLPWKQRAVTFLENHDTGYRTDEDNNPQPHHERDSFQNGWEVEQGYAYILTHPGIPTVYWKHYFDWGSRLQSRIKALINARKVADVHSGSALYVQQNAKDNNVYAAMVQGRRGQLYVRIGGNDDDWNPEMSRYANYRDYAHGDGWKVWVHLPGDPPVRQAPKKAPFEDFPTYRKPETIVVPDEWLTLD